MVLVTFVAIKAKNEYFLAHRHQQHIELAFSKSWEHRLVQPVCFVSHTTYLSHNLYTVRLLAEYPEKQIVSINATSINSQPQLLVKCHRHIPNNHLVYDCTIISVAAFRHNILDVDHTSRIAHQAVEC